MSAPLLQANLNFFQEGIPKPTEFKLEYWFFWALFTGLSLLVFSIQTNRHKLLIFFKSMVNRPLLLEYVDDYDQKGMPADWSLFFAGFAAAPLLFSWLGKNANEGAAFVGTLALMGAVLFKTIVVEHLGRLFAFKPLARAHNAVFFQFLFGMGMLILAAAFVYTLGWFQLPEIQGQKLALFFFFGYVLYFIRLSSVLWFTTRSFGVYYILYLCTLELIPLGILIRWSGIIS
jgi:hypothetical protein